MRSDQWADCRSRERHRESVCIAVVEVTMAAVVGLNFAHAVSVLFSRLELIVRSFQ